MGAQEKVAECLICGDRIKYTDHVQEVACSICGDISHSNAICESSHFVCDKCHSKRGLDSIVAFCLETKDRDAMDIANHLMKIKWVHMHGPEHHYLVAAALLTAYNNRGYGDKNWSLKKALEEARVRANVIPGGVCGFWGCCGAAISAGIFAAIISKATPLSKEERGNANLLTSQILERISRFGGPRCCKRDCFSALLTTMEFAKVAWKIELGDKRKRTCTFFQCNNQCIGMDCPFFRE